ncbi:MAG: phosphoadenosine phosphosulfate reductase family protein [Desulfobulbus sp.]
MNNVISLSGGKDSTAMLHMMLDRGEKIHSAVFFDTGWEFPEMLKHIDLVEQKTGIKIIRLAHPQGFEYWRRKRKVRTKKDRFDQDGNQTHQKGDIFRIGNGWPSPSRRWCTREKVNCIMRYQKTVKDCVPCIGYAADELHRCKPGPHRYPLIEYGVTEKQAIEYCRKLGYTWGGLYDIFNRVSCWCCPLQSLPDLRSLRKYRPELWSQLLKMDTQIPNHNRGFYGSKTVADLEHRFSSEEKLKPFYNGKLSRGMLQFINPHAQSNVFALV